MSTGTNGQQNQKNKKVYDKYVPSLMMKELEQKSKRLAHRLSRQQICKEHKLIANMNLKLQIKVQHLQKLQQLRNLKNDDVAKIINDVPFLEWVQDKNATVKEKLRQSQSQSKLKQLSPKKQDPKFNEQVHLKTVKLKYPYGERIIILTGITKSFTDLLLKEFNASHSNHHATNNSYKKSPTAYYQPTCEIVGVNQFWIAVEADTAQNAFNFKRHVRQRKKQCEEKKDFSFKEEKKRVRIVMQNQDFYTLLADAMAQKKSSQFARRLVNPNSGLFPELCLRDNRRVTPFPNEQYQSSLKKINKILYYPITSNKPESKDSEEHFTLDDVFSEQRSKTSEFYDSLNNMNDLIEKADQGTQAQSFGIGTNQDEIDRLTSQQCHQNHILVKSNVRISEPNDNKEQPPENQINNQDLYDSYSESDYSQVQQTKKQEIISPTEQIPQQKISEEFVKNEVDFKSQKVEQINEVNNQFQEVPLLKPTASLSSVREPQVPAKLMKIYFSTHSQTQKMALNYTKMKRFEIQYKKKFSNRKKLAPGIPDGFRQMSEEQRNRGLFFHNIIKSMERKSQRKQYSEYY